MATRNKGAAAPKKKAWTKQRDLVFLDKMVEALADNLSRNNQLLGHMAGRIDGVTEAVRKLDGWMAGYEQRMQAAEARLGKQLQSIKNLDEAVQGLSAQGGVDDTYGTDYRHLSKERRMEFARALYREMTPHIFVMKEGKLQPKEESIVRFLSRVLSGHTGVPLPVGLAAQEPKEEAVAPVEWVPKVGDYVMCIASENKVALEDGRVYKVTQADNDLRLEGVMGTWLQRRFRAATEEEVSAYNAAQEAEEVGELQEGDSCYCAADQASGIWNMLKGAGMPGCGVPSEYSIWLTWLPNENPSCPLQYAVKRNPVPYALFLKRAQGTAARLKREREEEEQKRVPVFGDRVKLRGDHDDPGDYEAIVVCKSLASPERWKLVEPGGGLTYRHRREFAIVSSPVEQQH